MSSFFLSRYHYGYDLHPFSTRGTLLRNDSRLACHLKFVLWMLLSSFVFPGAMICFYYPSFCRDGSNGSDLL